MSMPKITFTLTAVISADGFMGRHAREHPGSWASTEEQARFLAAVPGYDWAFMGRTTHETAFRKDRRRVVFSRTANGLDWREATHLWVYLSRIPWPEILTALEPCGRHAAASCSAVLPCTTGSSSATRSTGSSSRSSRCASAPACPPLLTSQPGDPVAALAGRGFAVVDEQRLTQRAPGSCC